MKRWRVYQHQHARFEMIGRSAGEYLESDYQDFKYRWTAGIAAWFYRGTSPAGWLTYTTEIVDLEPGYPPREPRSTF